MSSGDMFTFQPTFTQGLILGQCSILALLAVILKYLFFDTERSQKVPVYADPAPPVLQPSILSAHLGEHPAPVEPESTQWLNTLLHQVCACLIPTLLRPLLRLLKYCVCFFRSPVCIARN
jgi:maintenance of morphology protein 1